MAASINSLLSNGRLDWRNVEKSRCKDCDRAEATSGENERLVDVGGGVSKLVNMLKCWENRSQAAASETADGEVEMSGFGVGAAAAAAIGAGAGADDPKPPPPKDPKENCPEAEGSTAGEGEPNPPPKPPPNENWPDAAGSTDGCDTAG